MGKKVISTSYSSTILKVSPGFGFLNEIIFLTTNCFMVTFCQIEPVNGIQLDQRKFKGIPKKHKHHQKNTDLDCPFMQLEESNKKDV